MCDDQTSLAAPRDAFDQVQYLENMRLRLGKLCVIDATNAREEDREKYVHLAREHGVFAVAIVLSLSAKVYNARNSNRPDRQFGDHVIVRQTHAVRRSIRGLERERFRCVHVLSSQAEIGRVSLTHTRPWSDQTTDHGPFDLIGDIHGCYDELVELLDRIGLTVNNDYNATPRNSARKLVFLGDLVDRGPNSGRVLKLVMSMVKAGQARGLFGNHDATLANTLAGRNLKTTHGLAQTLEQTDGKPAGFKRDLRAFLDKLISHYATAALEVVSRFAIDPRWLIYVPPTMSPCETSDRAGFLEFPEQAIAYFKHGGVNIIVCVQKHMGSRAIVVVGKSQQVTISRFGIDDWQGVIYTRAARRLFQVPGQGVSADHRRTGIRSARAPRAPSQARPFAQALDGTARIHAWSGGLATI